MKRPLLDTYITNTHSYCPSLISSDKMRTLNGIMIKDGVNNDNLDKALLMG